MYWHFTELVINFSPWDYMLVWREKVHLNTHKVFSIICMSNSYSTDFGQEDELSY